MKESKDNQDDGVFDDGFILFIYLIYFILFSRILLGQAVMMLIDTIKLNTLMGTEVLLTPKQRDMTSYGINT